MFVIGITGGTASGKSTFVSLLKQKCHHLDVNFISQDDYYKDTTNLSLEEIRDINFDHPDALDFKLLYQHIILLAKGKIIHKPTYSFTSHNRLPETELINPTPVLVLEGILILNSVSIKNLCDTTIFIDAPEEIRMARRIERDVSERGRTEESVRLQFQKNISPMHHKYIEPMKKKVDYVFDGTQNFKNPIDTIIRLIQEQK